MSDSSIATTGLLLLPCEKLLSIPFDLKEFFEIQNIVLLYWTIPWDQPLQIMKTWFLLEEGVCSDKNFLFCQVDIEMCVVVSPRARTELPLRREQHQIKPSKTPQAVVYNRSIQVQVIAPHLVNLSLIALTFQYALYWLSLLLWYQ